ncbi:hypothetical protein SAMN06295912_103158 [Sphingomonas laterariae]|uniref:Uncharacterized protein n=1 Tax=Edaphosphingomonas laterariae TaxID=861865 RepID=A0A239D191_9SPHN|nr:hypothetical protein SAMN06295912_103158 [Sphingomonas laterariae]
MSAFPMRGARHRVRRHLFLTTIFLSRPEKHDARRRLRPYRWAMKKEVVALFLLVVLLLPMLAGIRRIRNLPRTPADEPADDSDGDKAE